MRRTDVAAYGGVVFGAAKAVPSYGESVAVRIAGTACVGAQACLCRQAATPKNAGVGDELGRNRFGTPRPRCFCKCCQERTQDFCKSFGCNRCEVAYKCCK